MKYVALPQKGTTMAIIVSRRYLNGGSEGSAYIDFDLSKLTNLEVERFLSGGNTVLHSMSYGQDMPGAVTPSLDWSAQWVDTQGMGNCGKLVLTPVSAKARARFHNFHIAQWMLAGLPKPVAMALASCRAKYLGEDTVQQAISYCLLDRTAREAAMAHPGTYGHGTGRAQWATVWGWAIPFNLSAPREATVAAVVQTVVNTLKEVR
jgi:hypothetical protein